MGADLCSTLGGRLTGPLASPRMAEGRLGWVREEIAPSRNGATRVLARKILEILYAKPCILGNICAITGPQNGLIFLC